MEIGLVGVAGAALAMLVLVAWLVVDLHPADRLRARPWLLVIGGAVVVLGLLVTVRTVQVGL